MKKKAIFLVAYVTLQFCFMNASSFQEEIKCWGDDNCAPGTWKQYQCKSGNCHSSGGTENQDKNASCVICPKD